MNTRNLFILVLLALAVVARPASAQYHRMSVDERVAMLKDTLHLSAPQADSVRSIYTAMDKERQEAFTAAGDDRDAMRESMGKLREKTDKKIMAILTPEQAKKYTELRKEQDLRRQQSQGGSRP